jgi:hypothetical protein
MALGAVGDSCTLRSGRHITRGGIRGRCHPHCYGIRVGRRDGACGVVRLRPTRLEATEGYPKSAAGETRAAAADAIDSGARFWSAACGAQSGTTQKSGEDAVAIYDFVLDSRIPRNER